MVVVLVVLVVLDVVALLYAPLFPPTSDPGHDHSHQEHYDQGDHDRDQDDHSPTLDTRIMKTSSPGVPFAPVASVWDEFMDKRQHTSPRCHGEVLAGAIKRRPLQRARSRTVPETSHQEKQPSTLSQSTKDWASDKLPPRWILQY
jgi:hypothetical protein